jgi:alkanesulfonate monooxygenase SsuD/methylene tetrahydromethanopterin reductase-like flavin-dependent oxidoreductase (luciferase family)
MRLGAHLPIADLGAGSASLVELRNYSAAAARLGYSTLAANDHLMWRRPWLDGPTTLAAMADVTSEMTLATTVTLPVVRHPVVVAKALTTLATLRPGQVVGGLGPGSTPADFAAVGVPFDERWARFDEAFRVIHALVHGEPLPPARWYGAEGVALTPLPNPPPQLWFASWGSQRRLTALASVADGWFASAYNAPPQTYAEARHRLDDQLAAAGRDPAEFPDSVATAWFLVTDTTAEAERILQETLAPLLHREPGQLRDLPVGTASHCAEVLARYAAAGAQELLLWPLRDEVAQLEQAITLVPHG